MSAKILAVCGTTSTESRTRAVLDFAIAGARDAGAEVRILDLGETVLPVMVERDKEQSALESVQLVRESADWADGFLLATPEYHGSMSGALKNWFDYLWQQLGGKTAGVMATTSAGHADLAITAVKTSFQWCHGWTLPFHAAARSADFEGSTLTNPAVQDRLQRIGHDVSRYAPILRTAFTTATEAGKEVNSGFAGLR